MKKSELQKIIKEELQNVLQSKVSKVTEARDSLAAYYNQAGKVGHGEYNLRNVLEEIDDLLRSIPDKTTRYELFTVISDAIDMVYELGMEEGSNQEKGNF